MFSAKDHRMEPTQKWLENFKTSCHYNLLSFYVIYVMKKIIARQDYIPGLRYNQKILFQIIGSNNGVLAPALTSESGYVMNNEYTTALNKS